MCTPQLRQHAVPHSAHAHTARAVASWLSQQEVITSSSIRNGRLLLLSACRPRGEHSN
jgi:hypothetical protein